MRQRVLQSVKMQLESVTGWSQSCTLGIQTLKVPRRSVLVCFGTANKRTQRQIPKSPVVVVGFTK